MVKLLSSPTGSMREQYDAIVVGSGYGGSIALSRLARAGKTVCLLERGKEMQPGDYPNDGAGLLQQLQVDTPKLRVGPQTALFDIRYNSDINVVVGCGLGGTSLINAGICLRPDPKVLASEAWPTDLRRPGALSVWFERAEDMLKPAASPRDYLESPKTETLRQAAQKLGVHAVPVPVLVNFKPLPNDVNHAGVTQLACIGCGDCVTGCNYHAKNTLIMNYLPDAKNHSAEIFTTTRVRYVEPLDTGWRVHGQYVDGGDGIDTAFKVDAKIVVLAAGTLGSTEILLRSRDHGLSLSNQIGNRFSGNGDTIGFAYNTDRVVNGIGLGARKPGQKLPIGPCSTAMIDWRNGSDLNGGMVMEDGAIPGALAHFLAPLFAVGARVIGVDTARGLWDKIKERSREVESKLLGAYTGAIANTLFLLVISHDDSKGRMYLDDNRLRVEWPGLGRQEQFKQASQMMERVAQALHGTYIQNPIWNELTDHNLVTGHPLGGCAMADDSNTGVVNHKGQVFRNDFGGDVHPGLYVMDGSVVPTALGVNPLLTISALAERSCHHMAEDFGWVINYQC
jgi:cholesterol oxidase